MTSALLAKYLGLKLRATQALISCAATLGFIKCLNNKYELSSLGKAYLDSKSPSYYGKVLDLLIQEHSIMNYEYIKKQF